MENRERGPADALNNFECAGFAVVPGAVGEGEIMELLQALDEGNNVATSVRRRGDGTYAIRNLLEGVPAVQGLANSTPIRCLVEYILGSAAFAVRGLFFDKTPEANWKVAWHQDVSIAVKRRLAVPGFGPWSIKAGVQHVQPPHSVLEQMIAVRLHLDDCGEANGPLQVLPGSHRAGKLSGREIQSWRARTPAVTCNVNRGGLVLMCPLLLHASSAAETPGHRRVIHLEFAGHPLPDGLEWLSQKYSFGA
jgi:ectoine hydroxylase-related dioxygenase (phytanoyl-CoA dioxygenase family)